jgi:hypothetical protein
VFRADESVACVCSENRDDLLLVAASSQNIVSHIVESAFTLKKPMEPQARRNAFATRALAMLVHVSAGSTSTFEARLDALFAIEPTMYEKLLSNTAVATSLDCTKELVAVIKPLADSRVKAPHPQSFEALAQSNIATVVDRTAPSARLELRMFSILCFIDTTCLLDCVASIAGSTKHADKLWDVKQPVSAVSLALRLVREYAEPAASTDVHAVRLIDAMTKHRVRTKIFFVVPSATRL